MASKRVTHNANREFSALTASGTKYDFSKPDDGGWRTVLRKAKSSGDTTLISLAPEELKEQAHPTVRKEFTGKLTSDVRNGLSLYIEIKDEGLTLVSEKVTKLSV